MLGMRRKQGRCVPHDLERHKSDVCMVFVRKSISERPMHVVSKSRELGSEREAHIKTEPGKRKNQPDLYNALP